MAELITPAYRALQRRLHRRGYGGKGWAWAATVDALAAQYHCTTVLDYGCGEGTLKSHLLEIARRPLIVDEYDPAIEGKEDDPLPAEFVVCTDVLEHVEPECLDAVLTHLRARTRLAAFVVIATRPGNKRLADGRLAHLTVQPGRWWSLRLRLSGWTILNEMATGREWIGVLTP